MKNKKISALLLVMAMLVALVVPVQAAEPVAVKRGLISTGTISAMTLSAYDLAGEIVYQESKPSATYTFSDTQAAGQPQWDASTAPAAWDGIVGLTTANGRNGETETACQVGWNSATVTAEIAYTSAITATGLDVWTAGQSDSNATPLTLSAIKIYTKGSGDAWEEVETSTMSLKEITTTTGKYRNLYRVTFDETTNDDWKVQISHGGTSKMICDVLFLGGYTEVEKIRRGLISTGAIGSKTLAVYDLIEESAYQQSKPSATFTFADTQPAGQPQWTAGTAEAAFDGQMGVSTADGKGAADETACQVGWNGSVCTTEIAFVEPVILSGLDLWRAQDTGISYINIYTKENGEWTQVTSTLSSKLAEATNSRTLYRAEFDEITVEDLKVEFRHNGSSKFVCEILFLGEITELEDPATEIQVISGNPLNEAAIARYADLGTTVTVADSTAAITWDDNCLDSPERVASLSNGNIAGWSNDKSTSKFNGYTQIDMYVDFDAPATFDRIDLWTMEKGAAIRTKSFNVYTSNDKENWLLQGSVVNENTADEPENHQLELITFHCQPTTAQYIKITSYDNNYQQVIAELIVFGEPPVIPLSATAPTFVVAGTDTAYDAEEPAFEGIDAVTSFTGGEGTLVVGWYDKDMKNLKKVWTATGRGDVAVEISVDEETDIFVNGDRLKAFVFGSIADVELLNTVAELNLGE